RAETLAINFSTLRDLRGKTESSPAPMSYRTNRPSRFSSQTTVLIDLGNRADGLRVGPPFQRRDHTRLHQLQSVEESSNPLRRAREVGQAVAVVPHLLRLLDL